MSWDWDAEDIDPDENDGKVWVLVTPKMLGEGVHMVSHWPRMDGQEPGTAGRVNPPGQTMRLYGLSQDSMSEQAVAPVLHSVQMPLRDCPMTILVNKEYSVLSDSAVSSTDEKWLRWENRPEKGDGLKVLGRPGNKQAGQAVPKNAPVVMSRMPRPTSCDRCRKGNKTCLSRVKGGKPLPACAGCHTLKMSCKMGKQH